MKFVVVSNIQSAPRPAEIDLDRSIGFVDFWGRVARQSLLVACPDGPCRNELCTQKRRFFRGGLCSARAAPGSFSTQLKFWIRKTDGSHARVRSDGYSRCVLSLASVLHL